jgi:hypothetical protein
VNCLVAKTSSPSSVPVHDRHRVGAIIDPVSRRHLALSRPLTEHDRSVRSRENEAPVPGKASVHSVTGRLRKIGLGTLVVHDGTCISGTHGHQTMPGHVQL